MKSTQQLYDEAHNLISTAANRDPEKTSWGIFTQQARFCESDPASGAFIWFDDETALFEALPAFCIYWSGTEETSGKDLRRIRKESQNLVRNHTHQNINRSDLVFRINNLLIPAGIEITWLGPFDDLLFSADTIPRLTRLFCRRTLADMEEHGIDPLSADPIEPQHLNTFIECLGDFGLEGQGLQPA